MDESQRREGWGAEESYRPDAPGRTEKSAERAVLAGLGAVSLAKEGAEEAFDRLVDRGQRVQEDWEQRMREARAERRARAGRLSQAVRGAMDAFLDTLSVPNKADVDTINVKLNILTRKIDELQMAQERPPQSTASHVPTPAEGPPTPDQQRGG